MVAREADAFLMAEEPHHPPAPEALTKAAPSNGRRVLLVDDSADDAELSLLALRRSGIAADVDWVRDGVEAMRWLEAGGAQRVDLILLDLKMPHMDGYEVLRRVKADPAMRRIPIAVMASTHGTPELDRCFELGADGYLVKPLEGEALQRIVEQLGTSSR